MRVTILLPQVLRASAGGTARVELEMAADATLGGVLDELGVRHPALERRLRDESRALRRYVNFYIGEQECRGLAGTATRLDEGAEIRVIPSVAGG
ncbi:MoaD/ThiS family protein [Haloactinomyces albus]|uniref:Molybdopterin converting factor small subunit n=1 Tax=Haloactinomyces albus TaxID=1352928 RepID=A0AAE4CM83_9ACTN|nr:MoaD/ThiS family protein [Haloactinomyces albus]MDR7303070.1 molybdopterin converting factor small subunit [Haloactinomyces albus]